MPGLPPYPTRNRQCAKTAQVALFDAVAPTHAPNPFERGLKYLKAAYWGFGVGVVGLELP